MEVPAPVAEARPELDDYFDRLDVAFQKLSANAPIPLPLKIARPPEPEPEKDVEDPALALSVIDQADQMDKYAEHRAPEAPVSDVPPVTYASPAPVVHPVLEAPVLEAPMLEARVLEAPVLEARRPAVEPLVTAVRPGTERPLPSIGEAFAAILAAEDGEQPDGRPGWPASFAIPEPTIEVTDDAGDIVLEFPFSEAILDAPDRSITRH